MTESFTAGTPRLPLEAVLTTGQLEQRGRRTADYEAESRALAALLQELGATSGNVLQKLVETSLSLCAAHSSGISLMEKTQDGPQFRWRAVAGRWAPFLGGTMLRNASPCGTVLDRNSALLFSHPERHFPIPAELLPEAEEVLLIPFYIANEPVGTVWIISHDESRRFDLEDQRLMTSLANFASTACTLMQSREDAEASAAENARAYEEARAANRARDEFFAALSHELRTPLTSVMGWSALLARHPDGSTALEASRAITSAALLQAQLIDDLLDVSRMMTGKFAIAKSSVDLRDIVEDVINSFRPAAESKGVELRYESSAPVPMSGDATRLRQVVSNLLSNAIKFTPLGGKITSTLHADGIAAVLTVSDTGEGIPAQFLPHVFERYAQLGERRHGGMGLGLAIVRHIVEAHAGSVVAASEGKALGTTFTVRLPAGPSAVIRNASNGDS